jgi:3-polyprenyl-4-hydroxybenzoate decarboxylase
MQYTDLRDWIQKVDALGELRKVEGADWNLEMGAITEVYARNEPYPAILFDKIKDYPQGIGCESRSQEEGDRKIRQILSIVFLHWEVPHERLSWSKFLLTEICSDLAIPKP